MSGFKASEKAVQTVLRSYRRQVDLLPTDYLRQFFRIKYGDDLSAINRLTPKDSIWMNKIRRMHQAVRKLEAANSGRAKAMDYILEFAYGRRGKLRWELSEPFLSSLSTPPIPERIIPAVEKSRPPVYSPELTALLTSSPSRMRRAKPLSPNHVNTPPNLPARANPDSEDARLYGPFSKRREVNIRWRHFASNHKKILPPLEIIYQETSESGEISRSTSKNVLLAAGIRSPGMQGTSIFRDVELIAQAHPIPLTRRERKSHPQPDRQVSDHPTVLNSHLPRKFLRRAYRRLLSGLPIMTYFSKQSAGNGDGDPGRFTVTLHENALSTTNSINMLEADRRDTAWLVDTGKK
ncbi:hypothetical protein BXZ70DRAFT_943434 [Cristinia sonorae]|uniref:LYR motif-containing protein Cup1-like N-terminal domain-containing protein n=1 Tax=Cristinia sonorae TaxID=1940300 RepID=A0A8K0UM13_9AGAR|nr:hypothetical protein BXZ70DRAFT_943434 [Cristinia sonorae]